MDASTGYLVREGFGSELGIDFNGLFAYTNFGPADQINCTEIGLIPAPTVASNEFELALRRDAVLEGGNLLFPQDSIRLLFRDAQFDDDLPTQGSNSCTTSTTQSHLRWSRWAWPKPTQRAFVFAPTTCLATASSTPTDKPL